MPKVRPVDATDEALLVGTCKEFLPKSEGCVGGVLGVAETLEAVGRLLAVEAPEKWLAWSAPKMVPSMACMWC